MCKICLAILVALETYNLHSSGITMFIHLELEEAIPFDNRIW